ncbi:hypothetical protein [Achromobacter ruhlandii]|uniref:hypothetical protein n=1 Tax=Achromobacter ruhlandii TaxID=72557 RepID=UPI0006C3C8CA|nr:hypothetical protein [Achromobacter ruhlandii]CUJ29835.1 Uncharacterised protein [Achromobacter ruhlandii]CUK16139.1 Uncharacterised protein [Achromobacter ruhlandii]
MGIGDPAAQATRALLQLARDIAVGVLGSAEEGTVREVFARLCYEADTRGCTDIEVPPGRPTLQ